MDAAIAVGRQIGNERPNVGDQLMSKRGNSHLRRLVIHGARLVSMHMKREQGLGSWLDELEMRTHNNVAVVALANTTVRISWAVLARQEQYRPPVCRSLPDPGTRTKMSASREVMASSRW
ncbi:hypothetical protein ACH0BU_17545 [Sphingomonas olei]